MPPDDERSERLFGRSSEQERARFGLLLFAIISVFAIQGIARPSAWEELVVAILLAATLLLSMWVAEAPPKIIRLSAVLATVLVLLTLVATLAGDGKGLTTTLANLLLVTVAPPTIVLAILRTLRKRNRVTVEALFGVLCVYLLLGMFFATVYGTIAHIDGSFYAQGVQATVAQNLYFSFTTLTTIGYGDLTAASNLGHTLSISEGLIGQVYLVTVVSVIVANLGRSRQARSDHGA